jgi:polyphosphate glucokinase
MSARTLCVDIGGTNIKAEIVDASGQAWGEPMRVPTPKPAVPEAVLEALVALAEGRDFDRVSLGFPGVVREGVTLTAPNLAEGWSGFRLVEMVLTLGTGMGAGLYVDGRLVPNLELGHHPFGDGRTYEERISDRELAAVGVDTWKARVLETIAQIRPVWNFRRLYLGGGNARFFTPSELPIDVVLCDNRAGVLGGVRLWEPERG